MDVQKIIRIRKKKKRQSWLWRLAQHSPTGIADFDRYRKALSQKPSGSKKKRVKRIANITKFINDICSGASSFMKYSRRMKRLAARGQLRNGVFFCKIGGEITQERLARYESLCHYMILQFLPAKALWEASMNYDDLVNRCRAEVFLALLNGFDPESVMTKIPRTPEQYRNEIQKLEQSIVFGRLRGYLRRETWKYHPDQFGGRSCSMTLILDGINQEFDYGIFTNSEKDPLAPLDLVRKQTDRLLDILERKGTDAVRRAFFELARTDQELISDSLFEGGRSRWEEMGGGMEKDSGTQDSSIDFCQGRHQ